MAEPQQVALVVPVHDNLATLAELHGRAVAALDAIALDAGVTWQLLYVDDASTDGSWAWIETAAAERADVRGIRLAGNVGQTRAICVGFEEVDGADVVATIDADLDFDPADLPRIVGPALAGIDVAAGVRVDRTDHPVWRLAPSRAFNAALRLTGDDLGDAGCGYFAVRRDVVRALPAAGHRRLAIRPLLSDLAGSSVAVPVRYASRGGGISAQARGRVATEVLAVRPRTVPLAAALTAVGALAATATSARPTKVAATVSTVAMGIATISLARRRRQLIDSAAGPLGDVAERTSPSA